MPMSSTNTKSDVYARFQIGSSAGRGSIAGWTPCPLCCITAVPPTQSFSIDTSSSTLVSKSPATPKFHIPTDETIIRALSNASDKKSIKLYSHGRGLAAHLHAVHTPWNPGKAELKRRRAIRRRIENEQRRLSTTNIDDNIENIERPCKRAKLSHEIDDVLCKWDPSTEEMEQWNQRVLEIVKLVELLSKDAKHDNESYKIATDTHQSLDAQIFSSAKPSTGTDRSGNVCPSYRDSLPQFLAAAANGDISVLHECINNNKESNNNECKVLHIQKLLSSRDRNGSTAEHWAAGGGHLACLSYLLELRDQVSDKSQQSKNTKFETYNSVDVLNENKKIKRRRDGKTSLHYAARNGHNACIDLIMSRHDAPSVDIPSGDGTTPLHLACYGGHISTVRYLIENYQANAHAANEWDCGTAHWAAMSLGTDGMDAVIDLCKFLKEKCGINFSTKQKQGHTPLHKAAAKKNRAVIEWLAGKSDEDTDCKRLFSEADMKRMGEPDKCGNIPRDIWLSVGGDVEFADWMKTVCDW